MAVDVTYSNVYMTYIKNDPYKYPSMEVDIIKSTDHQDGKTVSTGWHIIPNFLWRHVVVPRQWANLVVNYEAYKVKKIRGIMYNPIPITSNLSLQRINTFSAFNNCTYGITYTDSIYETSWFPWQLLDPRSQLHLSQREGLTWYGTQESAAAWQSKRYYWPHYYWIRPNVKNCFDNTWSQGKTGSAGVYDNQTNANDDADNHDVAAPAGVFWDPYNRPEDIGEFRAGKNSIEFSWSPAPCDDNIWFNLDQIAAYSHWTGYSPYCGVGRPGTRVITSAMDPEIVCTYGLAETTGEAYNQEKYYQDYTIPNMAHMPIMQSNWFWQEIGKTIANVDENNTWNSIRERWRMIDKYFPGPEYASCKYPPCQWFCKGIPLFDENSEHIKTSTQVSFKIEIQLECKKRRSAFFCPTWGPFSGDQLYGQTNRRMILQPNMIRYRTGGARIPWTNVNRPIKDGTSSDITNSNARERRLHPREDAYTQVQASDPQYVYNVTHRPAGIPDDAGTRMYTHEGEKFESSVRPHKRENIIVRFNRDSDQAEIMLQDD